MKKSKVDLVIDEIIARGGWHPYDLHDYVLSLYVSPSTVYRALNTLKAAGALSQSKQYVGVFPRNWQTLKEAIEDVGGSISDTPLLLSDDLVSTVCRRMFCTRRQLFVAITEWHRNCSVEVDFTVYGVMIRDRRAA